MLKKLALPLFAAIASIVTVLMARQISTIGDELSYLRCLEMFIISQELVLIYMIFCIANCSQDDGRCIWVCIRRATYVWVLTWILFLLCLIYHPF